MAVGAVALADPRETGLGELGGAQPPLGEQGRCFGDCQVGWVGHGDEYLDRVTVTVKLFAGLRERAGWSSRELDGVARVGDVWAALDLGEEPPGLLYAVNKAYAEPDLALADGDEVALIPPVSGGDFRLSEEPLDLDACVAEVESEQAGRDRDVRRHDADRLARPHRPPPRVRGLSGHGRAGHGRDRRRAARPPRPDRGRDPPPRRRGRDRRAERRDRRLLRRTAPTRSSPATRRSTPSRSACRSGRRRSTRAARSGSEQGRDRAKSHRSRYN